MIEHRTESPLRELYQSTHNLYKRFGLKPTKGAVHRKLVEEVAEVVHELYQGNDYALVHEIADAIVTLLGVAINRNIPVELVENAMAQVADKNNAKTQETHEVRNGMITKKLE